MAEYRLRGAVRSPDGGIGPPVFDELLVAADGKEAIAIANARDMGDAGDLVNALWLVDANGSLVWSLRREDRPQP